MTAVRIAQSHEADDAVFLSTLLRDKPLDENVLVWTLPDKLSAAFTDIDSLLAYVREKRGDHDIYIGVGSSAKKFPGAHRRFSADKITALYGLWADIDIRDDNRHKKSNLPETMDEALTLAYSTGLTPSLVVHSGGGLHVWWLFEEPLIVDDGNRPEIQAFVANWLDSVKRRARIKGWTIDATQDLARVLRIPGTTNFKDPEHPLPVALYERNDVRYNGLSSFIASIEDAPLNIFEPEKSGSSKNLAEMTLPEDVRKLAQKLARSGVIKADAQPPAKLWHALITENPKAKKTFDHKRPDLKDDSLSDFDFSLALMAMQADEPWTYEQITQLLIWHRSCHAKSEKDFKLRADYYARTLLRAESRVKSALAAQEVHDMLMGVATIDEDDEISVDVSGEGDDVSPKAPVSSAAATKIAPSSKRAGGLSVADWAKQFSQGDDDAPAKSRAKVAPAFMRDEEDELDVADDADDTDDVPEGDDAFDVDDDATEAVAPEQRVEAMPERPLTDDERRMRMLRATWGEKATPKTVIRTLNHVFENRHFDIVRVVRMVSSPPLFSIVIVMKHTGERLTIHLGDINGVMSQRKFVETIAAYASVVVPMRKQKEWENVVAIMLAVAENEGIGAEATERGMMTSWLDGFIDRYMISRDWSGDDGKGVPPRIGAFTYNGKVCFIGQGLIYWLRTDSMERVSPQNLGKMLRALDAENISVPFYKGAVRTTVAAWALPYDMSERYLRSMYEVAQPSGQE